VQVKHAVPLGNCPIEIAARDTLDRGLADALIISGVGTGEPVKLSAVERVRRACPAAKILLGSGVTVKNAQEYLPEADGFIVGSSLKREGRVNNPVDVKRVTALARRIR
jgi:predicted TIM-barrel enzyme